MVCNNDDIGTTPPSCYTSMNISKSNLSISAEDIPESVYRETNIDTRVFDTKDLLEVLMMKSVDDDLEAADVKTEERGWMTEGGEINAELEKLQQETYKETITILNHTDLGHTTKAVRREKQRSTKPIIDISGEGDESRREKFRAAEDESIRSISVGSIESVEFVYNYLKSGSLESIEFDHNRALGTLDIVSESMDSIESIVFECSNPSLNSLDVSDSSMESIETTIEIVDYNKSLRNLDTYVCFTQESTIGAGTTNLDLFESWRIFSIEEEED